MKLKGRINNVQFNIKGEPILLLDIYEKNTLLRELESVQGVEICDIEIKKHRSKRSLNANNYLWVLVNELGNVLNLDKEEVYLQMLRRYGQSELVSVLATINVKGFFKYYDEAGRTILNGKEFVHYKIYKGSSEYDTKEMSILIDGVVSECEALGISTMTRDELELLKSNWNASNS